MINPFANPYLNKSRLITAKHALATCTNINQASRVQLTCTMTVENRHRFFHINRNYHNRDEGSQRVNDELNAPSSCFNLFLIQFIIHNALIYCEIRVLIYVRYLKKIHIQIISIKTKKITYYQLKISQH